MKKKLLLFASMLTLSFAAAFAADEATCAVQVRFNPSEVTDWSDYETKGVYLYDVAEKKFYETEYVDSLSDDTYVTFAYNEAVAPFEFYATLGKYDTKESLGIYTSVDDFFANYPSFKSENVKLAAGYDVALYDMTQAGKYDPSKIEVWPNKMKLNEELSVLSPVTKAPMYAPGWEVLDAYIVKTEFGISNQEKILDNKATIQCPKQVTNPWDSQFWIVLPEKLPVGTEFRVVFDYKASEEYTVGTQAHTTPGNYKHWACIGDVKFKKEWQTFDKTVKVGNEWSNDFQSIAFNLSTNKDLVYDIKNMYVMLPAPKTVEEAGWEVLDASLVKTEYGISQQVVMPGAKGDIICPKQVTNPWDSQFWIVLPEKLPVGTEFKVAFDYKATSEYTVGTQAHTTPGNYKHWACIGDVKFKTDWQTFEWTGKVGNEWSNDFQSIAFNLSTNKDLVYSIKNLCVKVPTNLTAKEDGWDIVNFRLARTEDTDGPNYLFATQKATVHASAGAANDWDSQFFIVLPEAVKASAPQKVKLSFEYKSTKAGDRSTQEHRLPGDYLGGGKLGNIAFVDTEWKKFEKELTLDTDGMQTFVFNLSKAEQNQWWSGTIIPGETDDIDFFFKNICVKVPGTPVGPEEPTDIYYLKNYSTGKYLGWDGKQVVFKADSAKQNFEVALTDTQKGQFTTALTYVNGEEKTPYYLSIGGSFGYNFKTNIDAGEQGHSYWFEVVDTKFGYIEATKAADVEAGKYYIIIQNYNGYAALGGEIINTGDEKNPKYRVKGIALPDFKAETDYMMLPTAAYNSCVYLLESDVPTLVPTVFEAENNDVIYNTLGQRVNTPVKGINLINGQKILF